MKGFGIEIKNNLLEQKHVEKMGVSIWLYMWLIDKMTSINEAGLGKVLGGKPVKFEEVQAELGISERTYTRWIDILRHNGYISTTKTPHGLIFYVYKAFKRFNRKTDSSAIIGVTENSVPSKTAELRVPSKTAELIKTVTTKTVTRDVEQSSTPPKVQSFFGKAKPKTDGIAMNLSEFVLMCRSSPHRSVRLIGEIADEKKLDYKTCGQWRVFGTRNLRPAKELAPFTDDQIADAMDKMDKDFAAMKRRSGVSPEWGFETIVKYLMK